MSLIEENYDVIVVGAGHAGVEAALASARMGMETLIFTLSPDAISMMACNPNIGGSSKGHLVTRTGCSRRRDGKGLRPFLYSVQNVE